MSFFQCIMGPQNGTLFFHSQLSFCTSYIQQVLYCPKGLLQLYPMIHIPQFPTLQPWFNQPLPHRPLNTKNWTFSDCHQTWQARAYCYQHHSHKISPLCLCFSSYWWSSHDDCGYRQPLGIWTHGLEAFKIFFDKLNNHHPFNEVTVSTK